MRGEEEEKKTKGRGLFHGSGWAAGAGVEE
jgi:hypothetical protein